jgi:hypothetical protein
MSKKEVVFNMFRDEQASTALRAWNQLNYLENLDGTHGDGMSEAYFNRLSKEEKTNVMALATRILVRGRDFVQKEVTQYKD